MVKPVSIKDVATLAGTSIATVSRICNGSDYPVSRALRDRVEDAIRVLGYRPNRVASNLRSKRATSIGIIIRDIGGGYFSAIAQGASREAFARNLMPLICTSRRDPRIELDFIELLAQYQVAGIILAGSGWDDEAACEMMNDTVAHLMDSGVTLVSCAPQVVPMATAMVDSEAIGREACKVLAAHGHRVIGLIGHEPANLSDKSRLRGFAEAAAARNMVCHHGAGPFSWQEGYPAALELLNRHPDITAFFACSDSLAVGTLRCLEEKGLRVPEDLSVMGVGDIVMASYTRPALSTFHVPYQEMGAVSVRLILDPATNTDTRVHLASEYVERNSVGPPRA